MPVVVRLADGLPHRLSPQVIDASLIYNNSIREHGNCLVGVHDIELKVEGGCHPEGSRIAVFGDSHAESAAIGLSAYARSQETSLAHFTKASCAPLLGFTRGKTRDAHEAYACGVYLDAAIDRLLSDATIETVYVIGHWPPELGAGASYWVYEDGRIGARVEPAEAVEIGLGRLIIRLQEGGKQVIVVNDVPAFDFDAMRRVISDSMPVRSALRDSLGAGFRVDDDRLHLDYRIRSYDPIRDIVAEVARQSPDVSLVDLRAQLCAGERCRYVSDGRPLYIDSHHLSPVGAGLIDWTLFE